MNEKNTQRIATALEDLVLPFGGTFQLVATSDDQADVAIRVGDVVHRSEVVWLSRAHRSDVQRVLARRDAARTLIVTRELPDVVRRELEAEGVSYIETGGATRVVLPSGLAVVRDRPPVTAERAPNWRWSPSAKSIAELLLIRAADQGPSAVVPPLAEVARESGWSTPQVSVTLRRFDDEGWTAKGGAARGADARRTMTDPAGLLDAFADAIGRESRPVVGFDTPVSRPREWFLHEAARLLDGRDWCLTGAAAAEELAGFFATVNVVDVYLGRSSRPNLETALRSVDAFPVDEGGRLRFRVVAEDVFRFADGSRPVPLASIPRIYADLLAGSGRQQDAARDLRERFLGY